MPQRHFEGNFRGRQQSREGFQEKPVARYQRDELPQTAGIKSPG